MATSWARPTLPVRGEGHAAPCGWQTRVQTQHVAAVIDTGEAEDHRLPQPAQAGDAYSAGAVRVEFKICGGRLAQVTQRRLGFAEPRGDIEEFAG